MLVALLVFGRGTVGDRLWALLAIVTVVFYAFPVTAQTDARAAYREPLRGVEAFGVRISMIGDEARQAGWSEASLTTDVELRLRTLGAPIVEADEAELLSGRPFLQVTLLARPILPDSGAFAYHLQITFLEDAWLVRRPEYVMKASPWEQSSIGIATDFSSIRDVALDILNSFVNDYLAANPRGLR